MFICARHYVVHCSLFWHISFGVYWLFLLTHLRVLMKVHLGCFYRPTSKYSEIEFLFTLWRPPVNQNYRNSVRISYRTPTTAINKAGLLTLFREIIGAW